MASTDYADDVARFKSSAFSTLHSSHPEFTEDKIVWSQGAVGVAISLSQASDREVNKGTDNAAPSQELPTCSVPDLNSVEAKAVLGVFPAYACGVGHLELSAYPDDGASSSNWVLRAKFGISIEGSKALKDNGWTDGDANGNDSRAALMPSKQVFPPKRQSGQDLSEQGARAEIVGIIPCKLVIRDDLPPLEAVNVVRWAEVLDKSLESAKRAQVELRVSQEGILDSVRRLSIILPLLAAGILCWLGLLLSRVVICVRDGVEVETSTSGTVVLALTGGLLGLGIVLLPIILIVSRFGIAPSHEAEMTGLRIGVSAILVAAVVFILLLSARVRGAVRWRQRSEL